MNQPQTPNNEVATTQLDGSIITPTKPLLQVCLEYRARLDEKTNEVAMLRELLDGALLALERAIKNIPKESTVVPYEDALWKIRKQLKQITKCNQ